jgi:sterol-4alpha-carboxylate 3-dehydrogenase (decarboxylating)
MAASTPRYSVLVVGGCGFVGYHLVRSFAAPSSLFAAVALLSRSATNTTTKHVHGTTYHSGDLTNLTHMRQLVDKIQPTVIINAASPSPVTGTPEEY